MRGILALCANSAHSATLRHFAHSNVFATATWIGWEHVSWTASKRVLNVFVTATWTGWKHVSWTASKRVLNVFVTATWTGWEHVSWTASKRVLNVCWSFVFWTCTIVPNGTMVHLLFPAAMRSYWSSFYFVFMEQLQTFEFGLELAGST